MRSLALALSFALAIPLSAQVTSDVRIPLAKEQIPTVVRIVHLDTLILQPRDTVRITQTRDSLAVDTLALVRDDTVRAAFPAWLALVPIGAFASQLGDSHDSTATPPDTLAPPVTVTPEPGTLPLVVTGAGAILLAIWLRRRSVP